MSDEEGVAGNIPYKKMRVSDNYYGGEQREPANGWYSFFNGSTRIDGGTTIGGEGGSAFPSRSVSHSYAFVQCQVLRPTV